MPLYIARNSIDGLLDPPQVQKMHIADSWNASLSNNVNAVEQNVCCNYWTESYMIVYLYSGTWQGDPMSATRFEIHFFENLSRLRY